jgi:hypothetical protein
VGQLQLPVRAARDAVTIIESALRELVPPDDASAPAAS